MNVKYRLYVIYILVMRYLKDMAAYFMYNTDPLNNCDYETVDTNLSNGNNSVRLSNGNKSAICGGLIIIV